MDDTCGDNRFEIIEKAKQDLLESTNISSSEGEMKVLDKFLFRCWQMGWLDRYDVKDSGCEVNCTTKSDDLEEAAELYYEEDCPYEGDVRVVNNEHDVWFPSQAIEDAFIAGAEWQKEKINLRLQAEYEKGLFDMREEMMKDVVEANVYQGLYSKYVKECDDEALANVLKNYNSGDKVKIIIIKTEQQ